MPGHHIVDRESTRRAGGVDAYMRCGVRRSNPPAGHFFSESLWLRTRTCVYVCVYEYMHVDVYVHMYVYM